ncbi:MAG: response regulator transcription factor, partial [Bacteroidetes bacterium]|nr:response regulator transcription factor [Bacteroidota bacterium]
YVVKGDEFSELMDAVLMFHDNGTYFKSAAAQQFFNSRKSGKSPRPVLNEREREVLELICTDMSYEQIAARLNLSQKAIEFHRHRLFNIFEVTNRAGLMLIALSQGIVSVPPPPPPAIDFLNSAAGHCLRSKCSAIRHHGAARKRNFAQTALLS